MILLSQMPLLQMEMELTIQSDLYLNVLIKWK